MSSGNQTQPTIPLSKLRPLWLVLPFLLWVGWVLPWFAPLLSGPWMVLAFFFWPVNRIAIALGIGSWLHLPVLLAYCAVLSLLLEQFLRAVGRRHGVWCQIRRRTYRVTVVALASLMIGISGIQFARWSDWPSRPAPSDHDLYALRAYNDRISDLYVQRIPGGFLDQVYVGRFRADGDLMTELIGSLTLEAVPPREVSEAFWNAPAHWWRPGRSGQFYRTSGYSQRGRGSDGDHYLFQYGSDSDTIWVVLKSNF